MPIQDAAKLLNTGVTVLKRKCRQYNIPRWPYRKLKSIQNLYKSMENLEAQQAESGIDGNSIRETKLKLFVEKESMMWDPAISLNQETKKLRQSNFKYEYKVRQEKGPQGPRNEGAEHFPEEMNNLHQQRGNERQQHQQEGAQANGMIPIAQMTSAAVQHHTARGAMSGLSLIQGLLLITALGHPLMMKTTSSFGGTSLRLTVVCMLLLQIGIRLRGCKATEGRLWMPP